MAARVNIHARIMKAVVIRTRRHLTNPRIPPLNQRPLIRFLPIAPDRIPVLLSIEPGALTPASLAQERHLGGALQFTTVKAVLWMKQLPRLRCYDSKHPGELSIATGDGISQKRIVSQFLRHCLRLAGRTFFQDSG